MNTINKDMTLGELLDRYPTSEDILVGFGMHCFSCPMSRMETIEEASEVHDIDLNLLLEKLNNMDEDCCCEDDCDCCEDDCCCGEDCNCDEDFFCDDEDCDCCCDDDCDCEDCCDDDEDEGCKK